MKGFEKESIKKVRSIDQLDKMLTVVGFKGWLVFLFFSVLILLFLFWSLLGTLPLTISGKSILLDPKSVYAIRSQVEGTVKEVRVIGGHEVKKGDVLIVLDSSSTQQEESDLIIRAPSDGKITWVNLSEGDPVFINDFIISMQGRIGPEDLKVLSFIPLASAQMIRKGMRATTALNILNPEEYGLLEGVVEEVMPYPISPDEYYMQKIPSKPLRRFLLGGDLSVVLVIVRPTLAKKGKTGLKWTGKGPSESLSSGLLGETRILLGKVHPIDFVLPSLRHEE